MAKKVIEFTIGKDGTVTERPIEGFTGKQCHEETRDIEIALGVVTGSEPTEAAFRSDVVRNDVRRG